MPRKESWLQSYFWLLITTVSGLIIAFGVDKWVDLKNIHPKWMVIFGIVGLGLAVYFGKIRTATSMGKRK